jgi:hypothetical protein
METIMGKNKVNVLFVTEKWCDANPSKGVTNNYHNLFKTFKTSYPDAKFSVIHMDEYSLIKKKHIDTFLPSLIDQLSPDIVVFSLLGKSHLNPTEKSFRHIQDKGCKTVFMWPDMFDSWGIPELTKLNEGNYADLHVCWGAEKNVNNDKIKNLIWLWAPQDEGIYFPADEQKTDVSFLGSPRYQERQKYLKHLVLNSVPVHIGGGQREENLTPPEYARLMRESKISLNFPEGPEGNDQCKGRVWEILASKSLLLERKNDAIKNFLKPNIHYVEFENEADLVEKIDYYLKNEKERLYIAKNGHKIYKKKYNSDKFWSRIMKELEYDL